MRSDRKVIILDNIKSDCIEQAMFILKDTKPDNIDAVREAERIVENYTKKYHYTLHQGKFSKKKIPVAVAMGIVLGCAVFLGLACALWII